MGKRTRPVLVLAAFLALSVLQAGSGRADDIRITVGASGQGTLAPDLFGSNLQWTGRGDGLMPGETFDPGAPVIKDIKDWLAPSIIRFPGGLMASRYVWTDGVTAAPAGSATPEKLRMDLLETRNRGQGYEFSGQREKMAFGSAEYLMLLSATEAQGMITVNLKRAPAETANWLKWLAEHSRELQLKPRPELPWWEVGNESYLNSEPSHVRSAEYVDKFIQINQALKKAAREANVEIKVGALLEANGLGVSWAKFVMEDFGNWNQTVMAGVAGLADFFIIHLYGPFDVGQLSDTAARQLILVCPERLGYNIGKIQDDLRSRGLTAPLMVTEFNFIAADPQKNWAYGEDPIQGAYVASMLIEYARRGIAGACYWSLIGNHNFGMIKDAQSLQLRPAGYLYRNLLPLRGARLLTTEYPAGPAAGDGQTTFTVSGLEPLAYDQVGVMALDPGDAWLKDHRTIRPVTALGLAKDGRNFLMVINRSVNKEARLTCQGAKVVAVSDLLSLDTPSPPPADGAVVLPPAGVRLIEYRR